MLNSLWSLTYYSVTILKTIVPQVLENIYQANCKHSPNEVIPVPLYFPWTSQSPWLLLDSCLNVCMQSTVHIINTSEMSAPTTSALAASNLGFPSRTSQIYVKFPRVGTVADPWDRASSSLSSLTDVQLRRAPAQLAGVHRELRAGSEEVLAERGHGRDPGSQATLEKVSSVILSETIVTQRSQQA